MKTTFGDYFLTGASFLVVPFLLTIACLIGAFIVLRTAPEREAQRKSECKFILKFLCVIAAILLIELINWALLTANFLGSATDEVKSFYNRQVCSILIQTGTIVLLYLLVFVAVSLIGFCRTPKENAPKRKDFQFVLTTTVVSLLLWIFVFCESYFILDSNVELILAGNGIAAIVVIGLLSRSFTIIRRKTLPRETKQEPYSPFWVFSARSSCFLLFHMISSCLTSRSLSSNPYGF